MGGIMMGTAAAAMMGGGGGGAGANITNQNIVNTGGSTALSTAGYRLNSSGIAEDRKGSTYTTLETWLTSGAAADYDVRVTVTSGTLTSGTTGSWLNLGTTREWYVQDTVLDASEVTVTMTVEISLAGAGVAFDTATVTLSAERI